MERFHFAYAADFSKGVLKYQPVLPQLDEVSDGYFRDILRIQSLGRIPTLLVGASIIIQTHDILAKFRLGISEDDPRIKRGHPFFDPVLCAERDHLKMTLQRNWFQRAQAGLCASGMTIGEVNLAGMIPAGGDETREGIEAVLVGMITGMWTAFKVVMERTWKVAVAVRPDLESQITTRERKQTGFRSLKRVRLLYGFTFRKSEAEIFHVLSNDRTDALASTRNLLVHTGGVIDEEFDEKRKTIRALDCFSAIARNKKVPLTGQIVCGLLAPVAVLGFELVRSVDQWLFNNP